jgi:SAM-dependent methyltransferase
MTERAPAFTKDGFAYATCTQCESLYATPRPSADDLGAFRAGSEALRFWRERFLRDTADARRTGVHAQRLRWLGALADEYLPAAETVAVAGPEAEALAGEASELGRFGAVTAFAADDAPPPEADVIGIFDGLQQLHDPRAFVAAAYDALRPGGLLLATMPAASGFDVQVLGEHSANVYFPQQINLLSVEGVERLGTDHGFELVELSTPGQLDVGIVSHALSEGAAVDRFTRYLLTHRDDRVLRSFQEFLQQHLLSSHLRVALRKP